MSHIHTSDKAAFIRNKFILKLAAINPLTEPKWGKMNYHQMVDHMADAFREANGKVVRTLQTPEEHVPKMQDFLMSDKPFRENTPNKLLPDTPPPPRHERVEDSIEEVKKEMEDFFDVFAEEPSKKIMNPFFGELNYERWVQLLYKHCWHHLKQFGVDS